LFDLFEERKFNYDLCFEWRIMNNQSSFDESCEKISESIKILESKKTKDFEEDKKNLLVNFSSTDETVACSPKNIKYCINFFILNFYP